MTLTQDEIEALMTDDGPTYVRDYENLSKRLLGCMFYGIRIEPHMGHRYIIFELEADNLPAAIKQKYESNDLFWSEKVYGSVLNALDIIDIVLKDADALSTLEAYDYYIETGINENHDIDDSKVFGTDETV